MSATPITPQEIKDGQVFTTVGALGQRFYIGKQKGVTKVINDVNKQHYAYVEYFTNSGFKVVGRFFGQTMSLFLLYDNCIKIID